MRRLLLATTAVLGLALPAAADTRFEARLAGQAILPAATFLAPPADAPEYFRLSGRFTGAGNARNELAGSIPGVTLPGYGPRPTGLAMPFPGQPLQGFSGIKPVGDGSYWVTGDNGFGNRRNSPDALLMIHRVRPNWQSGAVAVENTIFLSDPNRVTSFVIQNEATPTRYLTGADFDVESIQPLPDGTIMIGDEFGPYLLHFDAQGRLLRVIETRMEGEVLRTPDHHANLIPANPTAGVPHRVRRSGGYEGMALTPDGRTLWAMMEQPLFAPNSNQPEGQFLRLLEFDVARMDWTGRTLRYRLEPGATAIGDINFIDARRALVIERDNGEGDPGRACAQGVESTHAAPCFAMPARLKRIYLVDFGAPDAEGFVRKIGHVDLMAIQDPERVARQRGDRAAGASDTVFTFPFFTIENVAMVDADHIIVGNDNNLPFSAGRHLTRADDNELILLHVPELLRAR
ncbi:esterase-like activity of phytase family protein [Roseococcus sp. SDR]|uniref:esterase-like activity of phytase family protein n=1 Tax=Roseococcus sp. SDR TaxID=2835532 RepID=UPI001BCC328B|nr:esterase-like activity of phytase family protein [Roseococcus sp. SDR]MBS7792771.1 esterase-like activity of phytase family protein [Roseococcus sp. SDR]MBV1848085.1 esterase-like activity of phytase family protein [Roseococcus sp. SDR]